MATVYKVLGQSAPAATTATTLYTVPASTQAVVSTIFVCNRGGVVGSYRIAIRPAGVTLANQHYIIYDTTMNGNSTDAFTNGITLGAGDVVTVYASNANFTFSIYGSEIA